MDCSPPGSSVHGILQAKILEGVAISFSGGSSWSRDRTRVSCIAGRFFTNWATGEAHPGSIRDHKECAAGIAENGYHSWSWPPPCCPAPDACLLAHAGTGCRNSGFRGQIWEENRGWLCRESEGTGVRSSPNLRRVQDGAPVCHNSPIVDALWRERQGLTMAASFSTSSHLLLYKF